MEIGVLGTGMVGQAIATRLVELGHDVVMGSRDPANPKATSWVETHAGVPAGRARAGSFADAASHWSVVFSATAGMASLDALAAAGADNLSGTVIIDVANALDYSRGMPPSMAVPSTDSLAEQIQRAYPRARVVKALNTMNNTLMVHPELVPGLHDVFIAGDDASAKAQATELLREFGWPAQSIVDLGGLSAARGLEMYLPLWLALMQSQGTFQFNIHVVRA